MIPPLGGGAVCRESGRGVAGSRSGRGLLAGRVVLAGGRQGERRGRREEDEDAEAPRPLRSLRFLRGLCVPLQAASPPEPTHDHSDRPGLRAWPEAGKQNRGARREGAEDAEAPRPLRSLRFLRGLCVPLQAASPPERFFRVPLIPAKAGIQAFCRVAGPGGSEGPPECARNSEREKAWVPACAGMDGEKGACARRTSCPWRPWRFPSRRPRPPCTQEIDRQARQGVPDLCVLGFYPRAGRRPDPGVELAGGCSAGRGAGGTQGPFVLFVWFVVDPSGSASAAAQGILEPRTTRTTRTLCGRRLRPICRRRAAAAPHPRPCHPGRSGARRAEPGSRPAARSSRIAAARLPG